MKSTIYNISRINKLVKIIAALLLILMLGLAFFSMRGDSATMDELAHIPAGYSYIAQKDMRLNPEHPPLLKDLAGLSVWLGSKITNKPIIFPEESIHWTEKLNGQWEFGRDLLYRSGPARISYAESVAGGNDADSIIFWGRLPMLLIMLILGIYVFKWARQLYGDKAGLIALFLYSLSPTFIAHGRYVTTDVGAAAAFFIATYYLVKWLKNQNKKNLIIAGLVFGLALLTKFSLVLLIPYFIFIVAIWSLIQTHRNYKEKFVVLIKNLAGLLLIGLIGMALLWPVYKFHVWNYPAARQFNDAQMNLSSYGNRAFADPVVWMSDKPLLRPYGQFFTGLLMVIQRSVGGNTTYFLGEISRVGWPGYFPIVFLIKVPLVLLILSLMAIFIAANRVKEPLWQKPFKRMIVCIRDNFAEFSLLIFFIIYWWASIRSTLNIGVRHVLPTFPIIYLLVSGQIGQWTRLSFGALFKKIRAEHFNIIKTIKLSISALLSTYLKYVLLLILFIWYGVATIRVYPYFLTYFNEAVGGPENGHQYVVDSNLDWGQDLKRLEKWVEKNKIDKIYLDYFGGGDPNYYLGEKVEGWWGDRRPDELPAGSWLAVSVSFLQGGRGCPAPNYNESTKHYRWLDDYQPTTIIGNSIFVYHL